MEMIVTLIFVIVSVVAGVDIEDMQKLSHLRGCEASSTQTK